jgi:mannose-6-phosphate isomerase-like protein (cupin superfamily)
VSQGKLKVEAFDGEGLKRAVEYGDWFVAIKNWKSANDVDGFDMIERHMQTDEVFVLLDGGCTLLVDRSPDDDGNELGAFPMERGKVYCIPAGVWHNTITTRDAKLVLVENRDTSAANSEIRTLTSAEITAAKAAVRAVTGP